MDRIRRSSALRNSSAPSSASSGALAVRQRLRKLASRPQEPTQPASGQKTAPTPCESCRNRPSASLFDNVALDTLCHALSYCDCRSIVTLGGASRAQQRLAKHRSVWKTLVEQSYPDTDEASKPPHISWRRFYLSIKAERITAEVRRQTVLKVKVRSLMQQADQEIYYLQQEIIRLEESINDALRRQRGLTKQFQELRAIRSFETSWALQAVKDRYAGEVGRGRGSTSTDECLEALKAHQKDTREQHQQYVKNLGGVRRRISEIQGKVPGFRRRHGVMVAKIEELKQQRERIQRAGGPAPADS